MNHSPGSLIRASAVAFMLMWFTTLAREPGGIEAFAIEVGVVESEIAAAAAAGIGAILPALGDAEERGFGGGLVCHRQPHGTLRSVREDCTEPQFEAWVE